MRRIKTFIPDIVGYQKTDGLVRAVLESDWCKIRRVLRAAELLAPTMRIDGTEIARNFCEAIDALNKEPKK